MRMYPNLRAEIARMGLSITDVARIIGKSVGCTSMKLNGKQDFRLAECKALSKALGLPIDTLFAYGHEPSGGRN